MLLTRVLSALVLAPIAVAAVYFGGWPFALFWAVAALVALWEWFTLVGGARRPGWMAGGTIYSGLLFLTPVLLRSDPNFGTLAILFLFAVVWTTDIAGYFAGRAVGGPKLAPKFSPKKTWAGAIAGLVGSVLVVTIGAQFVPQAQVGALAAVTIVLSMVSQVGDLAESALKRHFGAKDSSQIIPGHGGVMDRLDGFWAAALCAAIIGLARGGLSDPGAGLLVW